MHGEAQRALRTFPGKNEKESADKQMPSFPEMVQYIQEKVKDFSLKLCVILWNTLFKV